MISSVCATLYHNMTNAYEIEDQRSLANRAAHEKEVRMKQLRKSSNLTNLKHDPESEKSQETRELQKDPTLPVRNNE